MFTYLYNSNHLANYNRYSILINAIASHYINVDIFYIAKKNIYKDQTSILKVCWTLPT